MSVGQLSLFREVWHSSARQLDGTLARPVLIISAPVTVRATLRFARRDIGR